MPMIAPIAGSAIIPCLRYRDAEAAIGWLCGRVRSIGPYYPWKE